MIIGLSGKLRHGKDEVARFLCEDHGFARYSVGDVLLAILRDVNPLVEFVGAKNPLVEFNGIDGNVPMRMRRADRILGYEDLKDQTETRELMIKLGDSLRAMIYEDCLIDATLANAPDLMVMSSTRHPNEADKIRAKGGQVWRVERPGMPSSGNHATEVSMDDYDFDRVIMNDGTLDDLRVAVAEAVAESGVTRSAYL